VGIKAQAPPSVAQQGVALGLKQPNLATGKQIHERIDADAQTKSCDKFPEQNFHIGSSFGDFDFGLRGIKRPITNPTIPKTTTRKGH
jgi:hypothetical protein